MLDLLKSQLGKTRLIAVSKKQSADAIRAVYKAGQRAFGENYVQEAIEKQQALQDLNIEWHFIGNIQSNKTKLIAAHFDWVQSVNRLDIAKRLNDHCKVLHKILNICIEINIDDSPTKSGVSPKDILSLTKEIGTLKHLKLRGLMVMPDFVENPEKQYDAFKKAADLQQQLITQGFLLDTLSMGTSSDYEMAIKAGSNMVRLGTLIFGERKT